MKHSTPRAPTRRFTEIMSGNVASESLEIIAFMVNVVFARMKSVVEEVQNATEVVGHEAKKSEDETWRNSAAVSGGTLP